MAARAPRLISRLLQEYGTLAFAPLGAGQRRVDRENGIVYGVKVVGRESSNKHGVEGVQGTEYTERALREALPQYNCLVNCNHPDRDAQGRPVKKDRSTYDRLGKLFGARVRDGEVFADLRLLKSHPMAERVMEAAENEELADCFALSHNAWGRGEVKGGRYVITDIPEVRSVDLVADGGTNRGLFEGRERKMKLSELLESKPELAPKYAPLLALYEAAGDMAVSGEDDYRDHLHTARKLCEDAGDIETAGKIHKLMAPKADDPAEPDEPGENEDKAGGEKDEKKKDAMESRLNELERKDQCRTLCESLDFSPSALQLKALMALEKPDERKGLIADLKKIRTGSGARSRSLHTEPTPLQESSIPKDMDQQLAWLRN